MKLKKRLIAMMIIGVIATALFVSSASADFFNPITVNSNLQLPVYSAPSTSSWRGANGKALCSSNGSILAGGRDGDWVLIMYYLNHGPNEGGARVGYVRYSELVGLRDNIEPLKFYYSDATISRSCYLTDDPFALETPITRLSQGQRVTYLLGYKSKNGNIYGYIETTFNGLRVRGFVPYDALNINK